MTTPTGQIRASDVNAELQRTGSQRINLNDTVVRTLAGVGGSGTTISLSTLRGKSSFSGFRVNLVLTQNPIYYAYVRPGYIGTTSDSAGTGSLSPDAIGNIRPTYISSTISDGGFGFYLMGILPQNVFNSVNIDGKYTLYSSNCSFYQLNSPGQEQTTFYWPTAMLNLGPGQHTLLFA